MNNKYNNRKVPVNRDEVIEKLEKLGFKTGKDAKQKLSGVVGSRRKPLIIQ